MLRKLCSLWHASGVDRKRVRIYYKKYERMDLIEECKDPLVQDKYTLHRTFGQAAKRRQGIGFHRLGNMILFKAYILRALVMYI